MSSSVVDRVLNDTEKSVIATFEFLNDQYTAAPDAENRFVPRAAAAAAAVCRQTTDAGTSSTCILCVQLYLWGGVDTL